MTDERRIYHIVLPDKWRSFDGPSYEHESLASEGFIHCSFADQIDGVLGRYYSAVSAVTILEIDPARLTSRLVVEPSAGGEDYPHIYGPINVDAITSMSERKITLMRE